MLYAQQPDGSFLDGTRQARLRDPGFHLLGWGTQFVDGNLDGRPDLILTVLVQRELEDRLVAAGHFQRVRVRFNSWQPQ